MDGLGALLHGGGVIEAYGSPPIHPLLHSAFGPRQTVEAEPTSRDSLNRALGMHACIAVVRFKSVDEWGQSWLADLDQAFHRRGAVGMQWIVSVIQRAHTSLQRAHVTEAMQGDGGSGTDFLVGAVEIGQQAGISIGRGVVLRWFVRHDLVGGATV